MSTLPDTAKLKTSPQAQYQTDTILRSLDRTYYAYLLEQGLGKTFIALSDAAHLHRTGKCKITMVFGPNGIQMNWAMSELPKHWPDDIPYETALWTGVNMSGRRLATFCQRITEAAESAHCWGTPHLFILANIEAVRTQRFLDTLEPLTGTKFALVVDESTTIKNSKSIQTKAVTKLGEYATYRRILTGTPVCQGPIDMWAQARFLSKSALPYTSLTAFRAGFANEELRYFGRGNQPVAVITGYKNLDKLQGLIKQFSTMLSKDECLSLPPKIYQTEYVPMTPEQETAYSTLKKTCLLELADSVTSVTGVLPMLMKLHQITLGYIKTDEGTCMSIPCDRLNRMKHIIEGIRGKIIIFCRFREDIRQICEDPTLSRLGILQYHGGTKAMDRAEAVREFQNNPEKRLFVATSAGAMGITLTAATTVIYYSQSYRLEIRLQSEDRAHRIGQTQTVTYITLTSPGTIDEAVTKALLKKAEISNLILSRKTLGSLLEGQDLPQEAEFTRYQGILALEGLDDV